MATIEQELKTQNFVNARQKAVLSTLFTAGWLESSINCHLRPFDLSHEQYNILRILKGAHPKPLSVLEIKERMISRMSNVSRLVEKLRLKGLAERAECASDRRLVWVSLTEKGLQTVEEVGRTLSENEFPFSLTEEEATHLVQLLDKLRE